MADPAFTPEGISAGARMVLDPAFTVAEVDERLFGSFVEHMGRAVYGGTTSRATRPWTRTASAATCSS